MKLSRVNHKFSVIAYVVFVTLQYTEITNMYQALSLNASKMHIISYIHIHYVS